MQKIVFTADAAAHELGPDDPRYRSGDCYWMRTDRAERWIRRSKAQAAPDDMAALNQREAVNVSVPRSKARRKAAAADAAAPVAAAVPQTDEPKLGADSSTPAGEPAAPPAASARTETLSVLRDLEQSRSEPFLTR